MPSTEYALHSETGELRSLVDEYAQPNPNDYFVPITSEDFWSPNHYCTEDAEEQRSQGLLTIDDASRFIKNGRFNAAEAVEKQFDVAVFDHLDQMLLQGAISIEEHAVLCEKNHELVDLAAELQQFGA